MPKKTTESEIQFGAALKRARQDAKRTQTQAGKALHCSQSKIQKMEAADQRVTDQEVEILLDFYHASEETRLEISALRTLAAPGAPAGTPPSHQFLRLKELERKPECTGVFAVHGEGIPVPLQCDPYILVQYELAGDPTDKVRVLDERNARRAIFTRDNPPNYQVVLSESSLLRVPGGSAMTRREQARYLLTSMDEYPHLSVRILPFDAYVAHASTDMVLLRFAAGGPRPAVYLPYWRFGRLIQTKADVAEFEAYWQTLNEASLSEEESRKYLNNLTY